MFARFFQTLVLGCLLVVPVAAQTVRFDTNVGNIDFLLNPTGNPNLQGHVDNILAYVNAELYDLSVINRAAEGFVLQFGGFTLDPLVLPDSFDAFTNIPSFDPVIVDQNGDGTVDFNLGGLSNTLGTVSLALSGGGPNTGTSSFFVNLGDNIAGSAFNNLDASNFIPFAEVVDMATVDLILSLPQTDFAGGGLAGDDVPTLNGTGVVYVERAFVLSQTATGSETITFSSLTPTVDSNAATPITFSTITQTDTASNGPITFSEVIPNSAAASFAAVTSSALPSQSSLASAGQSAALQALTVPEPPALVLAVGALVLIYVMKPNKIR